MSGVDEQDRFPKCSNCGDLFYWIVRMYDNNGQPVIVAFVNAKIAVDEGRARAVVELEGGWCDIALAGIQIALCNIECGSCYEKASKLVWKKIVEELEKHWDMRECI